MNKNIIIIVVVAVIGFGAGFGVSLQLPQEKEVISVKETETIESSVFTQVFANVEGIVVEKTDGSIVLEKDGSRVEIIIDIEEGLTEFGVIDSENDDLIPISFDDVLIGTNLRGAVSIVGVDGTTDFSKENSSLLGLKFNIVE